MNDHNELIFYFRIAKSAARLKVLSNATAAKISHRQVHNQRYKAVIFDMGGVLVESPGRAFSGE